jgi:hypothetical protein
MDAVHDEMKQMHAQNGLGPIDKVNHLMPERASTHACLS